MGTQKLRALDPLLHHEIEDLLHKESDFIERFYQLVDDVVEPPFAISIDGLWGTGKTTVMQLLEAKFRDRNYPVFWFNPWKYSQSTDVVLAFLQALAKEHEPLLRNMKESGGKLFKVLLRVGLGATLKVLTQGNVSMGDVTDAFKKEDPSFESYKNMIEAIEKEFKELVNAISADDKYQKKPLIIFLDDFDRCLPQDAIKLLESLKNLFVTKDCRVVFICGIDTRVAKRFISKHYNVTDEFAINYFRKIFNLTVSMPYSADLQALLLKHIKELYTWDDPDGKKAKSLAETLIHAGKLVEMTSVRKYLNIIHNFFAFHRFHPNYQDDAKDDFVLYLLILKEAWQPVYESILQEALKSERPDMITIMGRLTDLTPTQQRVLSIYFGAHGVFKKKVLAKVLEQYPTIT
jgi:hypothetical protein